MYPYRSGDTVPTLESHRHWTPLDLEASSTVWSIERLRGYWGGTDFRVFFYRPQSARKPSTRSTNTTRACRVGWKIITACKYNLEHRKSSANGNAGICSHLPLPTTERDRSGRSRLTPSDEECVFAIRSRGLLPAGPSPCVLEIAANSTTQAPNQG